MNSYNTCSDLHNFLYLHIAKEFHGFIIHKPCLMKNPAMDDSCRKLIFPAMIDKMHLNPSLLLCWFECLQWSLFKKKDLNIPRHLILFSFHLIRSHWFDIVRIFQHTCGREQRRHDTYGCLRWHTYKGPRKNLNMFDDNFILRSIVKKNSIVKDLMAEEKLMKKKTRRFLFVVSSRFSFFHPLQKLLALSLSF